ncbi:hypothetical protein ACFQ1M_07200 [Sungkyunkwania multivorans]|uniref:Uncharacterized protein n=1 Tax=Sungkyunkwania multivorans TaxID=1173618 RepID=A0ABW3CW69_9FLAO
MNIEEMKDIWSQMSDQLEKQKKLTDKLIIEMTKEKFKNRFNAISMYETAGAVICFLMALFVIINFNKLDSWYLSLFGLIVVLFLVILPILSLRSIKRMKTIDIVRNNYRQTIVDFTKRRKSFLLIQKISMASSFILMLVSVPVASKLIGDKDVFLMNGTKWLWYFAIMGIFLFFFSRWVYRCYNGISKSAEEVLKELKDS